MLCFCFMYHLDLPEITYKGCFEDSPSQRTMPDLYKNFRGEIDWHNVRSTAAKCARGAAEKGYTYYGVQFYGECYGAPGSPDFEKYGEASPKSCPNG